MNLHIHDMRLWFLLLCFFIILSGGIGIHAQSSYDLSARDTTIIELDGDHPITLNFQDESGNMEKFIIQIEDKSAFENAQLLLYIGGILVALAMYFVFRFALNRSRKSAVLEAKLAHLERSALQAQMNPHFIFNSLNSIQSYIANNENDKANRFLAKFSRLIRAMLNLSRSQKVTLEEEIESLKLYMELEKMRFKDKFNFEIVVDEDIDTHNIELPPLLIQPYLENAILHGLAQTKSEGRIRLYYIMDGKYLLATVTDNGIGFEQSKKMREEQGTKSLHKSVGMTITQKRLEMLDEGNTDKKVDIQEIKDREGVVLGTKVEVKIRVN